MDPIAAAVLAGGTSRRMGTDKALVAVDGVLLGRRVIDALTGAGCHPVHVQGGDARSLAVLGVEVVPDRWAGEGPLSGVISALEHRAGDIVVAACDLPDLDHASVAAVALHEDRDVVDAVVATTDRRQPVLVRWNFRSLPRLVSGFESGERSLMAMLDLLVVAEVAVDAVRLLNANTPDDLAGR